MAVVVALNVAAVAAGFTVTDAGTLSVEFVFDKVTSAPPTGAALVRVTVQVLEAFGPRLAGVQTTDETVTVAGAVRVTVAFAELLL
jgi:hypothetical protein